MHGIVSGSLHASVWFSHLSREVSTVRLFWRGRVRMESIRRSGYSRKSDETRLGGTLKRHTMTGRRGYLPRKCRYAERIQAKASLVECDEQDSGRAPT